MARTGNPKIPRLEGFRSFWIFVLSPPTMLDEGARPRNQQTPKPHEFRSFLISVRAALAQHPGGTTWVLGQGGTDRNPKTPKPRWFRSFWISGPRAFVKLGKGRSPGTHPVDLPGDPHADGVPGSLSPGGGGPPCRWGAGPAMGPLPSLRPCQIYSVWGVL